MGDSIDWEGSADDLDFRVLHADDPDDVKAWMSLMEESPAGEVFAHPAYGRLFEDQSKRAMAAVCRSGTARVLYPFVMRRIDVQGAATLQGRPLCDLITPYGYGGAFVWGGSDPGWHASQFWHRFGLWAKANGAVTAFCRRSLFDADLLPEDGIVETRQLNIIRDLALSEQELWMDFEKKVRKNVRRAQASGVNIEIDPSGIHLEDFMTIYRQTMERRDAGDSYYFSRQFFEMIVRDLAGRFVFVHARHEGQIISTELVLLSRHSVYSFLGGTNSDYFHLRPNDLLKFEIIKWAKRSGYSQFVLGGGASELDGIFRYKRSFAPSGARPFKTGSKIFDQALLDDLVALRRDEQIGWEPAADYFPPYRS